MKRILQVGFWVCIAIGVLVVVRRFVALGTASRSGPPELANLDASFASHPALTLAHIIPALLFVLIVPVVVFGRGRLAGVLERVMYPLGAIVGVTAYAMSAFAVGGWVERVAVLVFDTWFLWCLARAWRLAGSGEAESRRRWLLRGVATLLGIATTRPVMGVFFATSRLTHWRPEQFFGYAFWIGFSMNVALIEVYIRRDQRRAIALTT